MIPLNYLMHLLNKTYRYSQQLTFEYLFICRTYLRDLLCSRSRFYRFKFVIFDRKISSLLYSFFEIF
ncbi:hypothetical protein TSAR_015721 [Trichomalopsis sarcophagae]|uniref:Uncharacterized protein n=1 Tax=Trichomalopsis sarcophagae TaxID=543379 RepID=A0A232EXW2_9HYME|nr:hypothetical protein TSAR_015721 [Trichomalopsis sarcophagae]